MSRGIQIFTRYVPVALATALVVACGGGSSSDGKAPTGSMKLSVTDAPVDSAQEVWVQFRAVEFKPEGGAPVMQEMKDAQGVAAPRRINLLPLQNGRTSVLLDGVQLPAGNYEWLRLIVDNESNVRDSYIMVDGNECELRIPSGDESGLKLIRGFTLPAGGSLALTADFDLRKSIRQPPGQQGMGVNCTQGYLMKPVLRLVQDSEAGAITGRVDPSLLSAADCTRMVYAFSDGTNAAGTTVPDDYDGTAPDPVQMVKADAVTGAYQVSFLPAGNYTVAYTCGVDDMEKDDALVFPAKKGATVQANLVTSGVDFPAAPAP
jgi:Domain of unknown function (DUF4382)